MAHAGRGLRWLHDDRPNAERLLRRVHNSCPLLRARIDRRPWPAMRMHVSTITATLGRAPIELIVIDHAYTAVPRRSRPAGSVPLAGPCMPPWCHSNFNPKPSNAGRQKHPGSCHCLYVFRHLSLIYCTLPGVTGQGFAPVLVMYRCSLVRKVITEYNFR